MQAQRRYCMVPVLPAADARTTITQAAAGRANLAYKVKSTNFHGRGVETESGLFRGHVEQQPLILSCNCKVSAIERSGCQPCPVCRHELKSAHPTEGSGCQRYRACRRCR